jgi:hypothetical protein
MHFKIEQNFILFTLQENFRKISGILDAKRRARELEAQRKQLEITSLAQAATSSSTTATVGKKKIGKLEVTSNSSIVSSKFPWETRFPLIPIPSELRPLLEDASDEKSDLDQGQLELIASMQDEIEALMYELLFQFSMLTIPFLIRLFFLCDRAIYDEKVVILKSLDNSELSAYPRFKITLSPHSINSVADSFSKKSSKSSSSSKKTQFKLKQKASLSSSSSSSSSSNSVSPNGEDLHTDITLIVQCHRFYPSTHAPIITVFESHGLTLGDELMIAQAMRDKVLIE